jgi:hypothetical protein
VDNGTRLKFSMRVLAGQMLIFLESVNGSNERAPAARCFIVAAISSAFCSLVNQFQRPVCSKMIHEFHTSRPALTRNAIVVRSGITFNRFDCNPNTARNLIQYFSDLHRHTRLSITLWQSE